MTCQLIWCNVRVAVLNVTLQLLVIYRLEQVNREPSLNILIISAA